MLNPNAVIDDFLQSHDLDYDQNDENTYLITLQGETKLQTHCALVIGDHSLSINAFVIRKPDENQEAVYEFLLKKNAAMYSVAFALNELGDIYLVGRLPLAAINEREIDRILGAVLQYSDSTFNPLLELGFSSAIRREWAWRVSRGESLANLQAFKHLI
ncbi:MAG: YbjN domain-containing protein [Actinomycetes bacterium]